MALLGKAVLVGRQHAINLIETLFLFSQKTSMEDDVYNFGFILFESLVGTIASEKGEQYFLTEKVREAFDC